MPTILAIDDKEDNLFSLQAIIKNYFSDVKLLKATSGKEGISIAIREQPDVIILDIIMPQMDGYETCKKIRQNSITKIIPIILLTAIDTSTENKIKGLNSGAEAFLTKPVNSGELVAQIKAMLRIRQAEDKLRLEKEQSDKKVTERTKELQKSNIELKNEVTERKQAEKMFRKSKSRLIEAQRIAKMGDFIWEIETGKVTWSDGMYDLLGYDKSKNIDLFIFSCY